MRATGRAQARSIRWTLRRVGTDSSRSALQLRVCRRTRAATSVRLPSPDGRRLLFVDQAIEGSVSFSASAGLEPRIRARSPRSWPRRIPRIQSTVFDGIGPRDRLGTGKHHSLVASWRNRVIVPRLTAFQRSAANGVEPDRVGVAFSVSRDSSNVRVDAVGEVTIGPSRATMRSWRAVLSVALRLA